MPELSVFTSAKPRFPLGRLFKFCANRTLEMKPCYSDCLEGHAAVLVYRCGGPKEECSALERCGWSCQKRGSQISVFLKEENYYACKMNKGAFCISHLAFLFIYFYFHIYCGLSKLSAVG
jgi:hypothetical protein